MYDNFFVSQKDSIRKKIEDAKEEIEKAKSKGDMPPQALVLVNSLLLIIEIMTKVFLEKKIRKNSSNSGIPPSQDIGTHNDRNKDKKKTNKKSTGIQLDNSRIEEETHVLTPEKCGGCGSDLEDDQVTDREKREILDIEYVIKKKIYTAVTKECSECGEENKAKFPQGIDGPIQYGIGVKAAIINFLMVQMMSLQRVQEHFKGLLGNFISQATMLKYIAQFHKSLETWEKQAITELLKASVMYVDETSMRVNKKNHWIHTYGFRDIVLQFIHAKRGSEAIEDIGIISKYDGIIVHDRYAPYFIYDNVLHALCIAHLLRDLKYVEDSTGDRWATRMKRLLKVVIAMVDKKKEKVLSAKEYEKLQRIYRMILSDALLELPLFPEPHGRGRTKLTDGQNLWEALLEHEEYVLLFTRVTEVDATNNRAERDLRMSKVKKKISGCFRNPEFAKYFCRISSYVKTMRNKGYSSLQAITLALKGEIPN